MKCPHCNETIPFILCPECGGETPDGSAFCCGCGMSLKKEEAIDSSERIPCSDGTCIGIINEKGVCNECGKPYAK
jgi:hypothetical protein